MKDSADALLRVINDLLDLSKVEAGKLDLVETEFSLRKLINETVESLTVRACKKGLELAGVVEGDAPDALIGDDGRLRQVLLNLIGNAIKFTDAGEITVRVRAQPGASAGTALLQFEVADTGIGIAPESQELIFNAFEQATRTDPREDDGTGLGLSISSRLVELMRGRITVESEPGRGSTFRFSIPLRRQTDGNSPAPAGADAAATRKPLRVLLAEDNEFSQEVIEQMLARHGHDVTVVDNGEHALQALMKQRFDLLLLDCHMPRMDGFQVAAAVRQRERDTGEHLPIVALTALSMKGDRERCLRAGMDNYLSKPIGAEEFYAIVDRIGLSTGTAEAANVPPSSNDIIDTAALHAACGGDAVLLKKLIKSFHAHMQQHLARVGEAVKTRDARKLRETAHKLRGLLSSFSTVAGDAAGVLEKMGADKSLDHAAQQYAALIDITDGLSASLERLKIEDVLLGSQ